MHQKAEAGDASGLLSRAMRIARAALVRPACSRSPTRLHGTGANASLRPYHAPMVRPQSSIMTFAFRFTLNAVLLWVLGSTFWYSCIIKQVCLPDPPAEGISLTLPTLVPTPGQTQARAQPSGTSDKPLSFAWNISEPVRGP